METPLSQVHLLMEIITPLVLGAIFVINLLQSKAQSKNKIDLVEYQEQVKEDLHKFNGKVRDSITGLKDEINELRVEVRVHAGKDEEYQRGLTRTLTRIDGKLESRQR